MALLDQLHNMEKQVARRLRELEPLVNEYHELQQVAERLGLTKDGTNTMTGRQPAGGRSARKRATASSRTTASKANRADARRTTRRGSRGRRNAAAPGSRQQDVLRLVNERPGISVPELGRELGVDPTGLYPIVRRLETRGQIRKNGRQLQPVVGRADATRTQTGQPAT